MSRLHPESHLVERIGWLRAAVLGANDGIVSTASLIVGVAAASARQSDILIAGLPGSLRALCQWRPASMSP
jgi:VIT1/CCC1 family predicted Fe2+/Mn2+ transporter